MSNAELGTDLGGASITLLQWGGEPQKLLVMQAGQPWETVEVSFDGVQAGDKKSPGGM